MEVYLFIEPEYETSPWCNSILQGLRSAFSYKKRSLTPITSLDNLNSAEKGSFLILVGSNPSWIKAALLNKNTKKIHPVILSSQPYRSLPGIYSYVTSDSKGSMNYLLSYFKNNGKNKPALYGVNINSLPNIARKERFLSNSIFETNEEDIFYNNGSVDECFASFEKQVSKYDCVICVNDYAAIHLIKQLERIGKENMLIASYGGSLLSANFYPCLLTVSTCYEEFGKAALSICETLHKNSALQYMSISVKHKIHLPKEEKTEELYYNIVEPLDPPINENDKFYNDYKMNQLLLIEKMLSKCDATDIKILHMLLENLQYEQIAEQCFISLNTVKYRVKQMCEKCGCSSKKELLLLITGNYLL
jgi:DNA-binding LacI/PurR family transcriptional regulator/DNA-binding CsgD family transcriptional regulator